MKITEKINFRQPKYMLPAIVYIPLLFTGYFICGFFNLEKVETNKMESTNYYNDKLPSANIKGDGIGNKYQNMVESFGKIEDNTAVKNVDNNDEEKKEEYQSQYSDAEAAALDSIAEANKTPEQQLEEIKKHLRSQNSNQSSSTSEISDDERRLLELRKALAEAENGVSESEDENSESTNNNQKEEKEIEESTTVTNTHAVKTLAEKDKPEEVVKKHDEASDYFNTISANEQERKLIQAIVDEEVKAVDGSRVRLRLLDDIDIGERTIRKGNYLYCTMSGFGQQRVKGHVTSVLVNDELVKINLSIYDMDGLEGLYVPRSSFRETTKDISSGALDQGMSFNNETSDNSFSRWGMQAIQNAYQKTTNAISKNIRKNKVKIKYGTHVYLINSRNIKNQ